MVSIKQLEKFEIFREFNNEELETLSSILTSRQCEDRDFVFHDGDAGSCIFFITKGQVQILKKSIDQELYEEINIRGEGDIFGEMAFLDDSVRSADARAIGQIELLVLEKDIFQNTPQNATLERKLVYQIALTISNRLKRGTERVTENFHKERDLRLRQYEFGQFFIYILLCYAIGMLINHVLYTRLPDLNIYNSFFAWGYLVVLTLPGLFLVWKLKIPWARVGVTLSDWKTSCREGIIASLAMVTLFLLIVLACQFTGILDSKSYNYDILKKPQYLLHSYGQEFLARGLLQNSLRRFFNDTSGTRSVIISSFLFSLLHIHFGLAAVLLTFVSSIALGYFYLRHQSLLGVTILHWSMGVCAFVTGLL